ncbi:MAG: ankyrin repeat protein [Enterobacterales bacterium]|jgi:ankyrin repeat protein
MNKSIFIFTIIFSLIACSDNYKETKCSSNAELNHDRVIGAIIDNNYPKFKHYLNCIDDVNHINSSGSTLLMHSVGYINAVSKPPDRQKFMSGDSTAFLISYPYVADLLEKGAEPDLRNKQGTTALVVAVYHGRLDSALLLLQKGANPNLFGDKSTPVMIAAQQCHKSVLNLLVSFGGDILLKNNLGLSASDILSKCSIKS